MYHYFYLARCADGSLYAGTCLDLQAREAKHNAGTGAKYTRSRRPVVFVYSERFRTLSAARKREAEVKQWSRDEKDELLRTKKVRVERPKRKKSAHRRKTGRQKT